MPDKESVNDSRIYFYALFGKGIFVILFAKDSNQNNKYFDVLMIPFELLIQQIGKQCVLTSIGWQIF